MDIDKAREAWRLYARRDVLSASVLAMRGRMERGPGTATVTVPTSWLPAVIGIAESEISDIDEQIARL